MDVFLLWHVHQVSGGEEDAKLIGVYATTIDAEEAKLRAISQPGFKESPDGFEICRYTLGEDHWTEGFITISCE